MLKGKTPTWDIVLESFDLHLSDKMQIKLVI